jgi:hypothetical protein
MLLNILRMFLIFLYLYLVIYIFVFLLSNSGPIDYIQTYVSMKDRNISARFTNTKQEEQTCHGALGDAFAAGTTDGCVSFETIKKEINK